MLSNFGSGFGSGSGTAVSVVVLGIAASIRAWRAVSGDLDLAKRESPHRFELYPIFLLVDFNHGRRTHWNLP